jgi:hypothetical protein
LREKFFFVIASEPAGERGNLKTAKTIILAVLIVSLTE